MMKCVLPHWQPLVIFWTAKNAASYEAVNNTTIWHSFLLPTFLIACFGSHSLNFSSRVLGGMSTYSCYHDSKVILHLADPQHDQKMSSFKNIILLKDKSTLSSVINKSYNKILDDGKSIDERSQRLAEMKTEADSSILQEDRKSVV